MDLPHRTSEERDYITMRTMTVVRQYLAAAFLLVIGLIAYGCGDSATVNPEATLANLTVNTGAADATLDPVFNPETRDYTVNLSNNVTTVTITAQPAVAGDTVTIDGQTTTSTSIALGQPVPTESTKTLRIDVANPPSSTRTYTVSLKRAGLDGNNSLRSLTVSPGTPPIAFEKDTRNYTVSVLNNVDRVAVTPTLDDPAATMTVNGQPATSGQARSITPLNPAGQSTTITILVRAQNGTEQGYTITVSRGVSNNNRLQAFTISPGSPGTLNLRPNVTNYTVGVGSNVTSVTVRPTLADATARMSISVGGGQPTNINSGEARPIPLRAGGLSTLINILVTAQDNTQRLYTVEVIPAPLGVNNNLRNLTVSPGPFTFVASTADYTLNVGSGVASVRVTPTLDDPTTASMSISANNGQPDGQPTNISSGGTRTITLRAAGQSTVITIRVTAQNGSPKPYTITVDRAAPPPPSGNNNLQSLTVSPGTLSPEFDTAETFYTVSDVSSSATAIRVTANPQDASASVTINGGPNSRSIPLPTGPSRTDIRVRVTPPNGNDKTYLISVNQPAPAVPPAPTVAPDLITADDSCSPGVPDPAVCAPGTSREDNVTTLTTPRFSIPPPGAGETAKLYIKDINGSEFPSSLVSTNTFRPDNPLPDGVYDITYTLSNSGGESGPSPVMMTPPPQLQKLRIDTTPLGGGGSTQ